MIQSHLAAVALTVGCLCVSAPALASTPTPAHCTSANSLVIRGDVPAAISFDVYRQLRPLTAQRVALFQAAGQVKRLPDGLPVCKIADDGVDDPSAVLIRLPQNKNTWWVNAANVQAVD